MRRGLAWGMLWLLAGATSAATIEQDEHALWQLWQAHQTNLTAHARMVALCAQAESRNRDSRFLPVVRSLSAWHLMNDNRVDQAIPIWAQLDRGTPADPLDRAAQRMARTWLTRIDREAVRQALQIVYRRNVQYPETLAPIETLDAAHRAPLQDRWGDPWRYEWAQFRFLRVSPGQRYRIESRNVRGAQDLREALKLEYGSGIDLRPVRLISSGSRTTVAFERDAAPTEPVLLPAGATVRGQNLAYLGSRILILADADHWTLHIKPGP